MKSAKEIREQSKKDIESVQEICEHLESTWCQECWAPGHMTGRTLKICNFCEKTLDTKQ